MSPRVHRAPKVVHSSASTYQSFLGFSASSCCSGPPSTLCPGRHPSPPAPPEIQLRHPVPGSSPLGTLAGKLGSSLLSASVSCQVNSGHCLLLPSSWAYSEGSGLLVPWWCISNPFRRVLIKFFTLTYLDFSAKAGSVRDVQ